MIRTNYVVNGFIQGFSVSCLDFKTTLNCRNLPSALATPEIVSDKVAKELLAGRMAGPLFDPPFQIYIVLHWDWFQRRNRKPLCKSIYNIICSDHNPVNI
jgi:hypothetical protein